MFKTAKLIILIATALNLAFPKEAPNYSFWVNLEEKEKLAFIQGYYKGLSRGLNILSNEAVRMRRQDKFWSPPFSHENSAKRMLEFFSEPMPEYSEIVKMIDALYDSPDNQHISIETTLHILMLHRAGKEQNANTLLLREQKKILKGR